METTTATVSNYAGGEQVGASWTDKIMNVKSNVPETTEQEDDDDQDWVCGSIFCQFVKHGTFILLNVIW